MLKLKLQSFGHMMQRVDSLEKTLMLGRIEDRRRWGPTKDEMVWWHRQLNGHEFEQTLGDGERQGSLVCCSPWGLEELNTTWQLNNDSVLLFNLLYVCLLSTYCVPKTENEMVNKNSISPSLVMLAYNQGKAPSIQLSSNKLKTLTMKNVARWRTWCCKKANLPKINLQQANLPKVNFPNDWFIEFPNRKFTERQFIQNQFLENQFDEK